MVAYLPVCAGDILAELYVKCLVEIQILGVAKIAKRVCRASVLPF